LSPKLLSQYVCPSAVYEIAYSTELALPTSSPKVHSSKPAALGLGVVA